MSWGIELWGASKKVSEKDQYDNLAGHTIKGIDFLDRYCLFVKERCNAENEYAKALRKLTKAFHLKKKEEDELQFSTCKAFTQVMNEINDMAGQHEMIAENLSSQVVKEISVLVKELKEERKSHLQEGAKLQSNNHASLNQLEKQKKAYEKAFKESEKASENYQKALEDLHLSRIELAKAQLNSTTKMQALEDSKKDYATQLKKTNESQRQHYTELMPKVFQHLQEMDEKRILSIQLYMKKTTGVQRQVIPLITKCLDEMDKSADYIDPKVDSELVIGRFKSGYSIPEDIPFDELIPTPIKNIDEKDGPALLFGRADTIKGTISLQKPKKRGGIFSIFSNKHNHDDSKEDYSDLPPNQRKKKLTQKVDNLSLQLSQETSSRDGLLKMKAAYEQNTALGDPESVEQQLCESNLKVEKLQTQLQKFQAYLAEAEGRPLSSDSLQKNGNGISEKSSSRNSIDSNIHNSFKSVAPAVPLPRGPTIGGNGNGISNVEEQSVYGNNGTGDFEVEPLPALGTARALYPFEAQSEGSIPMEEAEEFEVVELDQGDGWTRVRRSNMEEGFVPTSYIECSLYNSC